MNDEETIRETLVGELEEIRLRAAELDALVTKFEGASQQLVGSEGELTALRDCSDDPLVVYDIYGRALYINSSFVETFGWSPAEVLGRRIDYVPQECWPQTKETLERLFSGESVGPFATKRLTKVGRVLDIHIGSAMFTDTRGNPAGHIVTLRDIHRWNQRQRAVQESEQRLELALNGPDLTFWSWDVAGDLLERSVNWSEMTGYTHEDAVSSDFSWNQLVHPQEKSIVEKALKDHLEGRSPQYEAEYRLMTKTGEWKWVRDRGKVVAWDAQGNPLRVTGIQSDITARKRLEERIQMPSHSLITALEREREKISSDLHGKVAQDLAALRIAFGMLFEDLTRSPLRRNAASCKFPRDCEELSSRCGTFLMHCVHRDLTSWGWSARSMSIAGFGLRRTG
ncbi:MAG: PAS domain S-box protein [Deltaproteobacteria bacterium]